MRRYAPGPMARKRDRPDDVPPRSDEDIQPQDLVVTFLGAYAYHDPRPVWSGGLVELLGRFGFSTGSARVALTRLVARGLLERVRDGRFISYVLTERSRRVVQEGERRLASLGRVEPGDGRWTLVWYSIPDPLHVERHRFSRRLRFLGFGPLEDGVWVAPRDQADAVQAILADLDVERHASVFVTTVRDREAQPAFVARAWDLDGLAARYGDFLARFGPVRGAELDDAEAFDVRTRLVNTFRRFPYLDPDLPAGLAPPIAGREEAHALFHELYAGLADQAQRYFDARTGRVEAGGDLVAAAR